jgi:radical SAM protein with 4Fe4S-binding SPASM domain
MLENPPVAPYFTARPEHVSIEITARCNLRCHHCYNDSGPDSRHELPVATIEAVLDEVASWRLRALRLTGGEPTAHPGFRDVVTACLRRGLGIGLNTNGVWAADMLRYLCGAPIETFFISLDGLEPNNDAIRGRGTFRRAVETCRALRAAGQRVVIGFHVAEGNRRDVADLVALAARIGADFKVAPMRAVGRARRELPGPAVSARSFHDVVRTVTDLRGRYPHIRLYTDFDVLEPSPDLPRPTGPDLGSCAAGRSMIHLGADGGIYPCGFFTGLADRFRAGSFREEAVAEIWRRSGVFTEFRVQQKSAACRSCGEYRVRCRGGCPAVAYAATGRLDARDPTCFVDPGEPKPGSPPAEPPERLTFAELVTPPSRGTR